MNPPMINSTNSVSTTKRKREAERSVNWTVEETQVLLCAWSDERVQKSLAENLRNRHVFKHLSARMSEMGFSRSPHQCRLRVKTLKANYVRAKLQRSVDSSQPCTFKYFADMDAVLGRRSSGAEGGPYFASPDRMAERHLDSTDRTGSIPSDLNSNTEISGHHFGSSGKTGRQRLCSLEERGGGQSWQLDSEVKLEVREDSTDEFEYSNTGFPQHPRVRHHEVYLESPVHREISGTLVENSLSTPSPHAVAPPPPPPAPSPPPLTQSAASPPPTPPEPRPNTLHTSGHHHQHPESTCLEPVLKHLSECFQRLVSETRGLLVQLESQRQEQARWHQDILAQWLQREERRQRETAEREERREKARMEHEIRVLELLTSLAREHGCKCGGAQTVAEAPTGPNPTMN
ncbi:Zinc finger protein with KRAB and SCAN domains 2 [Nibea albiflora]|uniref:Zinc finger protein with KRAB and SCAN domains 2 n=1 Tax=Nibea albiflora TaxID=240163 RepID=A0ACB7FCT4_NIBAL|nr:Zinc finger protein with KRAB and SCAN domains 2 [Nibea albiflora]